MSKVKRALLPIVVCLAVCASVLLCFTGASAAYAAGEHWAKSPNIIRWSWGDFSRAHNLITTKVDHITQGSAAATDLTFDADGNIRIASESPVAFTGDEATAFAKLISGFHTDWNGVIEEDAATQMALLPAGVYYLTTEVDADGSYEGMTDTDMRFTVQQARNYWDETPNIIRWQFGETPNGPTAVPHYPLTDKEVKYTYYKAKYEGANVLPVYGADGNKTDTYTEADIVPIADTVKHSVASNTDVGTYILLAEVAGDAAHNYSGLHSETVFTITQQQNRWAVTPNIARWAEGEFDPAVNVVTGTAIVGDGLVTAEITPLNAQMEPVGDPIWTAGKNNGTFVSRDNDALSNAKAGWYELRVSVPAVPKTDESEGNNMEALVSVMQFRIFPKSYEMVANNWNVLPNIQGWKRGETPNAPVGSADHGTVQFTYYKAVRQDNAWVKGAEVATVANTNVLPDTTPVGDYILQAVTVYGADDDALRKTLTSEVVFHITEWLPSNVWVTVPSISGWVAGETPSVPTAAAGNNAVITYAYKVKGADDGTATAEVPTKAGNYVMIVTAKADGYQPLVTTVEFSVTEPKEEEGNGGFVAAIVILVILSVGLAAVLAYMIVMQKRKAAPSVAAQNPVTTAEPAAETQVESEPETQAAETEEKPSDNE